MSGPGGAYEGLVSKGKWTGEVRLVPDQLGKPLGWSKPDLIFVNSMSDLFHQSVPDEYIAAVFGIMAATPRHSFQILTKRPERAIKWFKWIATQWTQIFPFGNAPDEIDANVALQFVPRALAPKVCGSFEPEPWPLPNVWFGVSASTQATLNRRAFQLSLIPAAVRFVSLEPLVESVSVAELCKWTPPPWLIVGGESGPQARNMELIWLETIVIQCQNAGIPVFVKQDTARWAGRQGRIPQHLWLKEYPHGYRQGKSESA
jgi:protein gp37